MSNLNTFTIPQIRRLFGFSLAFEGANGWAAKLGLSRFEQALETFLAAGEIPVEKAPWCPARPGEDGRVESTADMGDSLRCFIDRGGTMVLDHPALTDPLYPQLITHPWDAPDPRTGTRTKLDAFWGRSEQ